MFIQVIFGVIDNLPILSFQYVDVMRGGTHYTQK